MHALVDLSLFAVSPTNDGNSAPYEDYAVHHMASSSSLAVNQTPTMKPLPPIPNRKTAALKPDPRSQLANSSRCILDRMRRLRLDTAAAAASEAAKPQRAKPTLQQRRRNPQTTTPSLTIPTGRPPVQERTTSVIESQNKYPPMIWLADEQIWLVADAARDRELYGFYAPAPSSDPGPWQDAPPLRAPPVESPPAYSSSYSASPPDSSDFSPVRTQFLTLMESQQRDNVRIAPESSWDYEMPPIRDDKAMSPLFQQAISGVDYLPTFSHEAPPRIRTTTIERRETAPGDECVSPLSPEAPACPWRMIRAASSRV